eukprot:gene10899-12896_t
MGLSVLELDVTGVYLCQITDGFTKCQDQTWYNPMGLGPNIGLRSFGFDFKLDLDTGLPVGIMMAGGMVAYAHESCQGSKEMTEAVYNGAGNVTLVEGTAGVISTCDPNAFAVKRYGTEPAAITFGLSVEVPDINKCGLYFELSEFSVGKLITAVGVALPSSVEELILDILDILKVEYFKLAFNPDPFTYLQLPTVDVF